MTNNYLAQNGNRAEVKNPWSKAPPSLIEGFHEVHTRKEEEIHCGNHLLQSHLPWLAEVEGVDLHPNIFLNFHPLCFAIQRRFCFLRVETQI